MGEKKIENPWCIRKGVMHFPMGIGKIEEEDAKFAMVRYSEGQLFPLQAWSKEYLERFSTFQAMVEKFAEYGFNKSHAACYALISYQTAYLKAHYPAALMAALMTSDYQNIDKIAIQIDECRNLKIEVLPPDVNESFAEFAVVRVAGSRRAGSVALFWAALSQLRFDV